MNVRRLTPSMSLLLAFDAAARHLSFTRAANELALTQSAVSRQVQALEELLEVALFQRMGRQIVLTEIGDAYARELTGALNRIRNASLQAMAYRAGGGSLQLAVLPTFAGKWLLPRLPDFYAQHPDILVHIHARTRQFDLGLAGMDAAIGVGDGNWNGLESHHLMDEVVVPVISPAFAAEHPIHSAADVASQLLLQVSGRPASWRQWFRANGMSESRMRLGSSFELTSHAIQAVVCGLGIGLLPDFLVEDELKAGTLKVAIDLPFDTGFSTYLFTPPAETISPHVAAFKNWLLKVKDR